MNHTHNNAYDVITSTIDKAKPFIVPWLNNEIINNPSTTYTVIMQNDSVMLAEQPDLPVDPIDHPHKNNIHFYFVVIKDTIGYEGYLYLLSPNYHISLLRLMTGEALARRKESIAKSAL